MLFWKDVRNGILLDRPLTFKLHQSYRPLPRCIREFNPVVQEIWSGPNSRGNAELDPDASLIKGAEQGHIREFELYLARCELWATTDGVSQVHKYRQERILRNG